MIRAATLADVPGMLALGAQLHAESPRWSRLTFCAEKVEAFLQACIEEEDGFAWVAEEDGKLVGGLIAYAVEHWSSRDKLATEFTLFVRQDRRGFMHAAALIERCKVWYVPTGAKWLQVGSSTGIDPERCARFYEALGFTRSVIGLEYCHV